MPDRKTITQTDYLALVGLGELAKRNREEQDRLSEAVAAITGEQLTQYGHYEAASEFVVEAGSGSPWGELANLLRREEITVASE